MNAKSTTGNIVFFSSNQIADILYVSDTHLVMTVAIFRLLCYCNRVNEIIFPQTIREPSH